MFGLKTKQIFHCYLSYIFGMFTHNRPLTFINLYYTTIWGVTNTQKSENIYNFIQIRANNHNELISKIKYYFKIYLFCKDLAKIVKLDKIINVQGVHRDADKSKLLFKVEKIIRY